MDPFEAELHAIALEGSQDYLVLRKLAPRTPYKRRVSDPLKTGLLIDIQTTGPSPHTDEIFEIGLVRFAYTPAGVILGPTDGHLGLRQPDKSLPAQITRWTGITNDDLAGCTVNQAMIARMARGVDLVITHDPGHRRFVERAWPVFAAGMAWACSATQIPWANEGFEGTRLFYLAAQQGFWWESERHRSLDECYALLELLEMPLRQSGEITLAKLLTTAHQRSYRIWALNAPFEVKDQLKARGYHWNVGDDGQPRAWYREVPDGQISAELTFLGSLGWDDMIEPLVQEIDAYVRFSDRQA